MIPQPFPESNLTLGAPPGMKNCDRLEVFKGRSMLISCWRPSFRERLSLLVFGKLWLYIHSPGSQPPVAIAARRKTFEKLKESKILHGWILFLAWCYRARRKIGRLFRGRPLG